MSFDSIKKEIQNVFHALVNDTQEEVVTYATPAIQYIEANGGKVALTLAETVLTGLATDAPWATIIAEFIPQAEKAGIELAEGAAGAILNLAKANLAAKSSTPV